MFVKFYNSKTPTNRHKKTISSILSSNSLFKRNYIKMQYFKKKIFNNHKTLSKTNSIYKINNTKLLLGSFVILNYIKVSYSNSFFCFIKSFDGCIFLKKLCYGFSFSHIYGITCGATARPRGGSGGDTSPLRRRRRPSRMCRARTGRGCRGA